MRLRNGSKRLQAEELASTLMDSLPDDQKNHLTDGDDYHLFQFLEDQGYEWKEAKACWRLVD